MATSKEFVEFVCEQIAAAGEVTYKKMFGEYMVYLSAKPVLIVCDNVVYTKMLDCVAALVGDVPTGAPYKGAKPHFVLDIDDRELCTAVVLAVEAVTPLPKPRKKKEK